MKGGTKGTKHLKICSNPNCTLPNREYYGAKNSTTCSLNCRKELYRLRIDRLVKFLWNAFKWYGLKIEMVYQLAEYDLQRLKHIGELFGF